MDNTNKNEIHENETVIESSERKRDVKTLFTVGIVSCPGFTGIRLRKEPDLSAETLEVLPEGTGVKIIRRHDAVWSEVEFGHKTGYAQNRFITTVSAKTI